MERSAAEKAGTAGENPLATSPYFVEAR